MNEVFFIAYFIPLNPLKHFRHEHQASLVLPRKRYRKYYPCRVRLNENFAGRGMLRSTLIGKKKSAKSD